MRVTKFLTGLLLAALLLPGATLEKLSLEEMIEKSSAIVRGRVVSSRSLARGPVIYTLSSVEILERWKGPDRQSVEVAIPGGARGGLKQEFSGAPEIGRDSEYVFFLWTGRSGINHVIGLSQGLFTITTGENGEVIVHRAASGEVMLDPKSGRPIEDEALTLALDELRDRVDRTLGGVRR
jgi:hypothetical protein